MTIKQFGDDSLAPVIPLRHPTSTDAPPQEAARSSADIYNEPPHDSIIRFHVGNPFGGYYFAAMRRRTMWKSTCVDTTPGFVTRTMTWNALLAKRPIAQVATGWNTTGPQDPRLRERLAVIRFKTGACYQVALHTDEVYPRGEWSTTVERATSPLFGYPSDKAIWRSAVHIEIATGWEDLGFPQLVCPPGAGPLADIDRDEDWGLHEHARVTGAVWAPKSTRRLLLESPR